jgi:hypothetical protein
MLLFNPGDHVRMVTLPVVTGIAATNTRTYQSVVTHCGACLQVSFVGTPLTHERYLRRARGSYGPAFKAGEALFPGECGY